MMISKFVCMCPEPKIQAFTPEEPEGPTIGSDIEDNNTTTGR